MTDAAYFRRHYTQSSFRRSDGRSQSEGELSTEFEMPACDEKLKKELKEKITDVVKNFVDRLITETKRSHFDDQKYLKTLFSNIDL